jgi:hypothetical protein
MTLFRVIFREGGQFRMDNVTPQIPAALRMQQPERRGIVFDLPQVVITAAGTLEAAGLSDRVTTRRRRVQAGPRRLPTRHVLSH